MLDRNKNHIINKESVDKAFANQSWKNMVKLLDEDLPVKKQENNKLIYALTGLLFLSTLAITYLVHLQLNEVPFAKVTKEEFKYIYVTQPQLTTERVVENKVYIKEPFLNNTIETNILNRSLIENGPSTFFSKPLYIKKQISEISHAEENKKEQLSELNKIEAIHSRLFSNNRILPFSIIQTNRKQNFLSQFDLSKVRFSLGLVASLVDQLHFSGIGIQTGIQFPISKKFSLFTGVGITELSKNGGTKTRSRTLTKESLYQDIVDFKQISVPLHINYNVTKGLYVFAGATYRKSFDISSLNLTKSFSGDAIYTKDNFGVAAGLSWALNNNLSFKLDYERGVNSIFNLPANADIDSEKFNFNFVNFSTSFNF